MITNFFITVIIRSVITLLVLFFAFSIYFELIYNIIITKTVAIGSLNFLKDWATFSAMLFGTTLISSIFEKNKDKHLPVIKRLFTISIMFLASTFAFLWSYTFQFIPNAVISSYIGQYLWFPITIIIMGISFALFAMALISLLETLITYRKKIDER